MDLFNKDATEAIAAYKKFLKDSGYESIRAERDRLQQKAEARRKAEEEYYANESVRKEKEAIKKSGLSSEEYFRKQPVKEFGYTPYLYDAGYILPNGKMLNFSGEKGRHVGTRY